MFQLPDSFQVTIITERSTNNVHLFAGKRVYMQKNYVILTKKNCTEHIIKVFNIYHFESKESIEASLVILDASDDDEAPPCPSLSLTEPSPICEGFHEES